MINVKNNLSEVGEELLDLYHHVKEESVNKYTFKAAATFSKKGLLDFMNKGSIQFSIATPAIHYSYHIVNQVKTSSLYVCPNVFKILPIKETSSFVKRSLINPKKGIDIIYQYSKN